MTEFIESAMEVGFSQQQAEFMDDWLAKYPHSHNMDEVHGLENALETLAEMEDEEEEE